ncbi:MAG TPA: sulfatase [Candidatus Dormibacteraeota bacterium]|nr:sulfatase [Candidatus Dormibacteraeota bacterium]
MMTQRIVAPAVVVVALAFASTADAGCTTTSEAGEVNKSVKQAVRCDYKALRSGPGTPCTVAPPPACADTLVGDAVALAYGPNHPAAAEIDRRALRDQLKCQKRIGKAVAYYVNIKLRYLIRGRTPAEAEAKAIKQLDKLAELCAVPVAQDVSGVVLPAVGPQCAAALGAPGSPVDITALRNCLRQLGEVWVDRNGPSPQPLRPNILFILSDDQRWDTTDDTHSPVPGEAIMPGVRRELAGAGVELTNGFMTTPLCCPSRSSILRGQYAHTTGVYTNSGVKGGADDFVDTETIGTLLQGAGYRTGFFGKYMNGYAPLWNANFYIPPGWSDWQAFVNPKYFDYSIIENGVEVPYGSAEADYSTDVIRERVKTFISNAVATGQPFFAHVSFKTPHGPFEPAPRHVGKYAGIAPWRPASYNEPDVSDKPTWVQNIAPLTATEQADLDAIRIAQLEMLQALDEAIGGSTQYGITGIMQHLRDLGIDDNTMVVYMSDNGWQWGEHRTQAKNKPYEESIRTAMFVRYGKLAPLPRVETRMALNIDMCPTFVELTHRAGDPPPTLGFDGTSLVRLVDGTAPTWRSDFLTEGWPANHVWASVREADWKYTELPVTPGDPLTAFELELYDLVNDPLELDNQANNPLYAARVAAMAARLRVLRPLWPFDADPLFEDPDE